MDELPKIGWPRHSGTGEQRLCETCKRRETQETKPIGKQTRWSETREMLQLNPIKK